MRKRIPDESSYSCIYGDCHAAFLHDRLRTRGIKMRGQLTSKPFGLQNFCALDLDDRRYASNVFHAYSAQARGIEMLNTAYHHLDLVPKGRDEDQLEFTQAGCSYYDEY